MARRAGGFGQNVLVQAGLLAFSLAFLPMLLPVMDISDLSRQLSQNLKQRGWHLDVPMQKCPEECRNQRYEKGAKSYCPYCGKELVGDDGELSDIEEALQNVDGIKELLSEEKPGSEGEPGSEKKPERGPESGVVEVDIPGVVDPRGRLIFMYSQDQDGTQTSQNDLLYEHWATEDEDIPLQRISVSVEIDVEKIFENRKIDAQSPDIVSS